MSAHAKKRFAVFAIAGLLSIVVAEAAMPKAGSMAPGFSLKSNSGKNLKLEEFRGQVVMINFWATWCGPCRQEMPHLNRLHERYHKAGFALLGVNIDDQPDVAREMVQKLGIAFPVLFDTDKRVSRLYDVDAMPSSLLIDRDGRIRYLHLGYRSGYEIQYDNQIRELLKQ